LLLLGLAVFGAAPEGHGLCAHLAALLLLLSMLFHATIDLMDTFRPTTNFELLDVPQCPGSSTCCPAAPRLVPVLVLSGVVIGLLVLYAVLAWCFAASRVHAQAARSLRLCPRAAGARDLRRRLTSSTSTARWWASHVLAQN
jgi:hypothetical protein